MGAIAMSLSKSAAKKFGPWALVTGASSGIGAEFARQLAASGMNVVLAARRGNLLDEVGEDIRSRFGVETRSAVIDLSEADSVDRLGAQVADLDVGLVVSNAGTGSPGPFLGHDRAELLELFRLNALSQLNIAYHFGKRFASRGGGGLVLGGAMGAAQGIPFMANDAGSKAYVQSLGESLHVEFGRLGIHVTVLVVPPTDTPVIAKLGLDPATMPMKPMSTGQCVSEALRALERNRSLCLPGRTNRFMSAVIPARLARAMMAKMFEGTLAKSPKAGGMMPENA
jgi:uncharacterized protein